MKKAVVLLSGGLDSATILAIAIKSGYEVYPLTFEYSQRVKKEINCAKNIVNYYKISSHKIVSFNNIGGSFPLEQSIDDKNISANEFIKTYIPARNLIFLSFAVAYAEAIEASAIYIGINSVDTYQFPDCKPDFINAFQDAINLGTKTGAECKNFKIITPLISLSKPEIITLACENNAPIHLTSSCDLENLIACGKCDSCLIRIKGFKGVEIEDPILYENNEI